MFRKPSHIYVENPQIIARDKLHEEIKNSIADELLEPGIIKTVMQFLGYYTHAEILYYLPMGLHCIRYLPGDQYLYLVTDTDIWMRLDAKGTLRTTGKKFKHNCLYGIFSSPYSFLDTSHVRCESKIVGTTQRFTLDEKQTILTVPYNQTKPYYLTKILQFQKDVYGLKIIDGLKDTVVYTTHYIVVDNQQVKHVLTLTEESLLFVTFYSYSSEDKYIYCMFIDFWGLEDKRFFARIPIGSEPVIIKSKAEALIYKIKLQSGKVIDYAKFDQTHAFLIEDKLPEDKVEYLVSFYKEQTDGKFVHHVEYPIAAVNPSSITLLDADTFLLVVNGKFIMRS